MQAGDIVQSVLRPAGPHADSIHRLWLLMLWTSATVFTIVLVFVFVALARGMRRRERSAAAGSSDRQLHRTWLASTIATVVVLLVLLTASVSTGRAIASMRSERAVSVNVTGHQWWWEFEYEDARPSRRVLIANELHLPLHQPVVLKVTSRDVIHSFWAPNLLGTRDLIPGLTTAIWFQADQAGRFRGQCAEFCGLQHAHMAFDVVVESQQDFERWLDHQRAPASPPGDVTARRGLDIFMSQRCARCHAIRGSDAAGQAAPDLTHLASRVSIAAGTLPNTTAHRQAWITDPQAAKPGNQMPGTPFSDDDMSALLAYLDTLR